MKTIKSKKIDNTENSKKVIEYQQAIDKLYKKDETIKEPKQTQGQKKLLQYLEDLKRNKVFLSRISKIRNLLKSDKENQKSEEQEKAFNQYIEEYEKYRQWLKTQAKKYRTKFDDLYEELAEEYGIDNELLELITLSDILQKKKIELSPYEDFCAIRDDFDIILNHDAFDDPPIELDVREVRHIKAYPISINIHQFASKRDVLDFIEKRWEWIDNLLETYRGEKKIRFRERKLTREMLDFIWENKDRNIKEQVEMFNGKFPSKSLAYYEIYSILKQEKRRRNNKITVGQ